MSAQTVSAAVCSSSIAAKRLSSLTVIGSIGANGMFCNMALPVPGVREVNPAVLPA